EAKRVIKAKLSGDLPCSKGLERAYIRRDGTKIHGLIDDIILKDNSGEITGVRGTFRDISVYKQVEEEKKELEVRLQYVQRMESIGTLAGGIAHNFNNLLMGIQGNASLMLFDIDPDHPHNNNLKNIEKLIQNGSRLTTQLLGYAREGKYEVTPIDLNQLVKNISDTFGTTRKEIRVHRELDENLQRIRADKGQIEEVLLNLFVNAADAMQGGGDLFLKTMNVTHEDMDNKEYRAKPGNYALFSVMDTGTGMDEETMQRIFEPFFTTKGLASSTGLGLASAYGIVKGHGGYIDVDSEKGKGTTFNIYIPVMDETVKEEKEVLGEQSSGKETLLLVDDEELVLEAGEQMLKKLGYDVLIATSGREALDLFTQHQDKIGVVLIDMIMPGMGGGETYDRMKRITPDIKAILISGYGIDGQATEILKRGCNAFIQKPFDMELLSRSISKVLNKE
ncbi:response regulator, partial [Thermodesulfobacteriota bacterium]